MPESFVFQAVRQVEFADTDLAGIMHFSNYFRWMEETEGEFFASIGIPTISEREGYRFGWPRAHADCKYRRPLRFRDQVAVTISSIEVLNPRMTLHFRFYPANSGESKALAFGSLQIIHVRIPIAGGDMEARAFSTDWEKRVAATIG